MQWNFDTVRETEAAIRPHLELNSALGNGSSEQHLVNHIDEQQAMERVGAVAPSTEIDQSSESESSPSESELTSRLADKPTRLSNGVKGHSTDEDELVIKEDSPRISLIQDVPPVSNDTGLTQPNGLPSPQTQETTLHRDDSIGSTDSGTSPKERHLSAKSITEETRELDEALSRSSVVSLEASTVVQPSDNVSGEESSLNTKPERDNPELYERVGDSSSDDEYHPDESPPYSESMRHVEDEVRLVFDCTECDTVPLLSHKMAAFCTSCGNLFRSFVRCLCEWYLLQCVVLTAHAFGNNIDLISLSSL